MLSPFYRSANWLGLSCCLVGSVAQAQTPTVNSAALNPARNARAASRTAAVVVPFSQSINPATASGIKLFSSQYLGQRTAAVTTNGNAVTVTPTAPSVQAAAFKPGETVFVTVPASVQNAAGQGVVPYVYQFTTAVGGGSGTFQSDSEVRIGPVAPFFVSPSGSVTGDIDGDGDLDLLTSRLSNRVVDVRLNQGNSRFTVGTDVILGPNDGGSMALGDVDGDGDLDLLLANFYGNTVSIRVNSGNGSFSNATEVPVGDYPKAITLGDIDGDADLDMLVHNYPNGAVSIRLNNGRGDFSGSREARVGSYQQELSLQDLDNDGDLDMLAITGSTNNDNYPYQVSTRLNDGQGNFGSGMTLALTQAPDGMAVGDIDADGDLDLLVGVTNAVRIYANMGDGSFGTATTVSRPGTIWDLKLGDVDGDGDLDLLVMQDGGNLLLNNGNGSFSAAPGLFATGTIHKLHTGDVDGDGDLDLLAVRFDRNTVSILLNQGAVPTSAGKPGVPTELTLFPNPVGAALAVQVSWPVTAGKKEVQAIVLNALGQVAFTQILSVVEGKATGVLPTTGLAAGVYVVRLQAGAESGTQRLVVF